MEGEAAIENYLMISCTILGYNMSDFLMYFLCAASGEFMCLNVSIDK